MFPKTFKEASSNHQNLTPLGQRNHVIHGGGGGGSLPHTPHPMWVSNPWYSMCQNYSNIAIFVQEMRLKSVYTRLFHWIDSSNHTI